VSDLVIALAGGAVGTLLIGGVAVGVRVLAAWREIDVHDRAVGERNEDLEQWVADDHIRLKRSLTAIRDRLAARNLIYSGEYGRQISEEKEGALHSHRDQERDAKRDVARIKNREGWLHETFRGWRRQDFPDLEAPKRVQPVLGGLACPAYEALPRDRRARAAERSDAPQSGRRTRGGARVDRRLPITARRGRPRDHDSGGDRRAILLPHDHSHEQVARAAPLRFSR
jgi:hypothetical protein